MLVLLLSAFVLLASHFATDSDYCTTQNITDSVGHAGIVITCQSGI
jgi:hypothetical protein